MQPVYPSGVFHIPLLPFQYSLDVHPLSDLQVKNLSAFLLILKMMVDSGIKPIFQKIKA